MDGQEDQLVHCPYQRERDEGDAPLEAGAQAVLREYVASILVRLQRALVGNAAVVRLELQGDAVLLRVEELAPVGTCLVVVGAVEPALQGGVDDTGQRVEGAVQHLRYAAQRRRVQDGTGHSVHVAGGPISPDRGLPRVGLHQAHSILNDAAKDPDDDDDGDLDGIEHHGDLLLNSPGKEPVQQLHPFLQRCLLIRLLFPGLLLLRR
mmetsp:Transcript_16730/g.37706  ORF Transcript_16730/g.37706 Transcript_16730/m.37706 type:complete len:207 (-) Transcript_16730:46-666(-)